MSRLHLNSFQFRCFSYLVAVGHLALAAADSGFHSQICFDEIVKILQGGNSSSNWDPSIFSDTNVTNPSVTYRGCQQICGPGTGWYTDIGPRLVEWFLPIFLLVFNMQFASIGKERFLMIIHLLGDPMDSTWSLLAKVDSWSRCFSVAKTWLQDPIDIKCLAIIIAATEEVLPTLNPDWSLISPGNSHFIRQTGIALAENRRNEILRTLFAVAMYVFQVLAAFIPAIGAASSPSGGRIGTAMLLSWLLSVVILSNAVGNLGSHRNCQQIVMHFIERLDLPHDVSTECFTAYSGAIHSYRSHKRLRSASERWLAFTSVLPVSIAFGTAFAVLDTGPTYFSCRHIFVIIAFGFWFISAVLTFLLSSLRFVIGKHLWYIILAKDLIIGVPILVLIISSSCGLWNSCYCFGGVFVHGEEEARITPNPTEVFNYNNTVIYPATVGTCLFLQVCVFVVMLFVGWPGFRVMWWFENEKLAALATRRYPQVSLDAAQSDLVVSEPASAIIQVKEDKPYSTDQIQNAVHISGTSISSDEPEP